MKQTKCTGCRLPLTKVDDTWVVMGSSTTADGLSYCPPDPDHDGEFDNHYPGEARYWCFICGFDIDAASEEAASQAHLGFDPAHEPNWYVGEEEWHLG